MNLTNFVLNLKHLSNADVLNLFAFCKEGGGKHCFPYNNFKYLQESMG